VCSQVELQQRRWLLAQRHVTFRGAGRIRVDREERTRAACVGITIGDGVQSEVVGGASGGLFTHPLHSRESIALDARTRPEQRTN
jgi:hypothetical protein